MNSKVGIFGVLLFGIMMLFIPVPSFSITEISEQEQEYYDNDLYMDDEDSYNDLNRHSYKNDNYDASSNSYDYNYKKNKSFLFTCPESEIIVDKKEKCPESIPEFYDINKAITNSSNGNCFIFGNDVQKNSNLTINCNVNNLGQQVSTQTITVNKFTTCDPIKVGQEICDNIPDAKILVVGNNANPSIFLESQTPIHVTLEEGVYSIKEKDFVTGFEKCLPPFEAGRNLPQFGSDVFICSKLSSECEGIVIVGNDNLLCDIENVVFNVKQDLVTANFNSNQISVFLGDGNGTFGTSTEFTVGVGTTTPNSVAIGFFNADTNLDIVTANFNSHEISVFLGNGDGTFGTSAEFTVGVGNTLPISVAVGFFDADTHLDLVTANRDSHEISVFLGNGDGTFGTSTEFTVGGTDPSPFSVAVGFFNVDTNLDIVTANINSNEISVFLGNGDGTFATSTEFTVGGSFPGPNSVAVGFFDADTHLDLVTANGFSNEISVFLGNGDGTFDTSTEFTVGGSFPAPNSVAVGFFDADTNLDIVTANINSNEISVFLGNGDGTFGTSTEFTVGGTGPNSVAVGFFNVDTNLDIVTANSNFLSGEISVFLGNGDGTFGTSTEFTVGGGNPETQSVAVGNFN